MANKTVRFISNKMKNLDICMMNTLGTGGTINTRPMSNNRDVTYKGESFFFSRGDTRKVKDIKKKKAVTLAYEGTKGLYIIVTGKARLLTDKATLQEHWVDSLNQWFKDGIETEGLTLIAVKADHIHYWDNYKEGDIDL